MKTKTDFSFIKKLTKAQADSQRNASLLEQYHELYELQRKRLEKSIGTLTDERELWMRGCYSIALKVLYENRLSTAKQLNIAEKTWYKLARHLSLLLYDTDTKDLNHVSGLIENWKITLDEVRKETHDKEDQTSKSIESLQKGMKQLKTILETDTL